MPIAEPITTLTDYILAIECIVFMILLVPIQQNSVRLWAAAFATAAIAAALGGTCHGFAPYLSQETLVNLWHLMMALLGFTSFFLLGGTVISALPRSSHLWLLGAIALKLGFHLYFTTETNNFLYAVSDYLSAMAIVFVLQLPDAFKRLTSAILIISGIVVSGIAASVLWIEVAAIDPLTPNDVYHLIQMIALYLLFRGAKLLKDR